MDKAYDILHSFNCHYAYNKVHKESRLESFAKVQTVPSFLRMKIHCDKL